MQSQVCKGGRSGGGAAVFTTTLLPTTQPAATPPSSSTPSSIEAFWFPHVLLSLHPPHPLNHRRPFFSFVCLALVNHGTFWVVVEGGGREGGEEGRREKKRKGV